MQVNQYAIKKYTKVNLTYLHMYININKQNIELIDHQILVS